MTESAYLAWIRSALRSKSLRWPPMAEAMRLARRPYIGPNKLQKWEHQCALCLEWFKASDCVKDHYPRPAGSILCVEDIGQFANNLYCEVDNIRILCDPCHKVHTLAEKQGISFEDAKIEKAITEQMKDKNLLDFLNKNGYNGASVSNVKKRKEAVSKIIKGSE